MRHPVVLIFVLLSSLIVNGQKEVLRNFTVQDGLPVSQVHFCMQDSEGYMWFGTGGGGVCRYDGYEFEVFDVENGLLDNEVYQIFEDSKGRVWFGTLSCQLSYYKDGKVHSYAYNDVIPDKINNRNFIRQIVVDDDDNVWLGLRNGPPAKIDARGNFEFVEREEYTYSYAVKIDDKNWLISGNKPLNPRQLVERKKNGFTEMPLAIYNESQFIAECVVDTAWYEVIFGHSRRYLLENGDSRYYLGGDNSFHKIDEEFNLSPIVLPIELQNEVFQSANLLPKNRIIFAGRSGAFLCSFGGDGLLLERKILEGEYITDCFIDNKGSIWFTTINNGIFYLPSIEVLTAPFKELPVFQSQPLLVNPYGELFYLNGQKTIVAQGHGVIHIQDTDHLENFFYGLHWDEVNNELLAPTNGVLMRFNQDVDNIGTPSYPDWIPTVRTVLPLDSGMFYGNSDGFYFFYYDNADSPETHPIITGTWVQSLYAKDNTIYVGSNDGLYLFNGGELTEYRPDLGPMTSSFVTNIIEYNGYLVAGTQGAGVSFISPEDDWSLNESNGLCSNNISDLRFDNDTLWVSTNKGLNKVVFSSRNKFSCRTFNAFHGLLDNEIHATAIGEDTVYVASNNGLTRFVKGGIPVDSIAQVTKVVKVEVEGLEVKDFQNGIALNYDEDNLRFFFRAVNFKLNNKIEYRYRLKGFKDEWEFTSNTNLQYTSLDPGNFTFEVQSKNEDGIWGDSALLEFSIRLPFWKEWWFILFVLIVSGGITLGVVLGIINRITEKAKNEQDILELRSQALRAQMNPHFIFNTLNSIQHFIVLNDIEQSNRYLSKFAQLIRIILSQSEKKEITIAEELAFLKLYLDIEKMRFDEEFVYTINIDENLEIEEVVIPSMILQPYVENAIWHGLLNSKKQGNVDIRFEIENDQTLHCFIQDNGIGRENSQKLKSQTSKDRKSVGITLTKKRLDLLSKTGGSDVQIIDLVHDDNSPAGTLVKLTIPIKYLR